MKILFQLAIVFGLCLVGQLISGILPITIPASIISLVLLLLLLLVKAVKPRQIQEVSEFLLKNMAFLFIPAGVSVVEQYTYLKGHILILALICVITTLLTFLVAAFTVTGVMRLQEKILARRSGHE
ncbi:MAG: CidA/LrgA family protein [Clostridiales bacterium]|jgi:holin-like protein|nr:CidA/LrgA family protein [Clostridiales bacterium]